MQVERFIPRFLTKEQYTEAINLYHLARSAGKQTKYERMLWAAKWIAEKYTLNSTAAYKDISAGLEGY